MEPTDPKKAKEIFWRIIVSGNLEKIRVVSRRYFKYLQDIKQKNLFKSAKETFKIPNSET